MPKIKTTVTIDEELLAWIRSVKEETGLFSSPSHAVDVALRHLRSCESPAAAPFHVHHGPQRQMSRAASRDR